MDKSGKPIPFVADQSPLDVQQKSIFVPRPARTKHDHYDLAQFMAEFESVEEVQQVMADLVVFFNERYGNWQVGENASLGMAYSYFYSRRAQYWPCVFRTDLRVELSFQWVSKRQPFSAHPELFLHFVDLMSKIFGYTVGLQSKGRPSFPIHMLTLGNNMSLFKNACLWFRDTVLSDTLPAGGK